MKIPALYLSLGLAVCAAPFAAAEEAVSKDEQKLEQAASQLDKDADRPEGPKRVEDRLKSEYKVDDARIQGLRDQKLGYGEISIALALAEKRPGGISDANVAAVMAERNGPPKLGWGRIAKNQGTKLGKVKGRLERVSAEKRADRAEKREDRAEKREDRAEKRADRVETHQTHEKPSHGNSKR